MRVFLIFTQITGVLYHISDQLQLFILFQTQSIDNFLSNEHHRSSVRQKLAPVALSKFSMKIDFFEKTIFGQNLIFFEKIEIFANLPKLRESRVFVVQSSYGAHSTGNCLYFAFGIK